MRWLCPLLAGCGGLTVDPGAALGDVCAIAPAWHTGELAELSAVTPVALEQRPAALHPEFGYRPPTGHDLPGSGSSALAIDPRVRAEQLVPVLQGLEGEEAVALLVDTAETWGEVTLVDPAYAADFRERLAQESAEKVQVVGALELERLTARCGQAADAIAEMARASAQDKCVVVQEALAPVLGSCWFTDGDRIVTALQVLHLRQRRTNKLGAFTLQLSPEGQPVVAAPDETWQEIAPRLHALEGRSVACSRSDAAR